MHGVRIGRRLGLTERVHEPGILTILVKAAVWRYSGDAVLVSHLGRVCRRVLDNLGSFGDAWCELAEDLGWGEAARAGERLGQCSPVANVAGQRQRGVPLTFQVMQASRGTDEQPLGIVHGRDDPLAGRDGLERRCSRGRVEEGAWVGVASSLEGTFFLKALLGIGTLARGQRLGEVDAVIVGVVP